MESLEGHDRGVVERGRPQGVEGHDVCREPEPVVGELAPEPDPVVELADHGDVALPEPIHERRGRFLHVIQAHPHAQGGVEQNQDRERRRLGSEEADLLRYPVLAHHEVVGGQAGDEAAALVADGHPEVDGLHLDLDPEGILRVHPAGEQQRGDECGGQRSEASPPPGSAGRRRLPEKHDARPKTRNPTARRRTRRETPAGAQSPFPGSPPAVPRRGNGSWPAPVRAGNSG